jgi:hypothetical protein
MAEKRFRLRRFARGAAQEAVFDRREKGGASGVGGKMFHPSAVKGGHALPVSANVGLVWNILPGLPRLAAG